jgi:hypothetical protein
MLENNRRRIQNLTGLEIWLFIVGRFLAGIGVGIIAMIYFPAVAAKFGWPLIVVGLLVMLAAAHGMFRKSTADKVS